MQFLPILRVKSMHAQCFARHCILICSRFGARSTRGAVKYSHTVTQMPVSLPWRRLKSGKLESAKSLRPEMLALFPVLTATRTTRTTRTAADFAIDETVTLPVRNQSDEFDPRLRTLRNLQLAKLNFLEISLHPGLHPSACCLLFLSQF